MNLITYGFVHGRSCLTNQIEFFKVDDGKAIDIFYVDSSKAFDKVGCSGIRLHMRSKEC